MEQSTFTKISKQIGWAAGSIDLPSKEEAEKLFKAVETDKSIEAFTKVFKFYRFGKSAQTFAEMEVLELIDQAFNTGSKHFK